MAIRNFKPLTEEDVKDLKEFAEHRESVNLDLVLRLLDKNGFYFGCNGQERAKQSYLKPEKSRLRCSDAVDDEDFDYKTYDVFSKNEGYAYDMFVNDYKMCLIFSYTLDDPDYDLSDAWVETQYNLYGERYLNYIKEILTSKKHYLKKELNQVDKKLELLDSLQSSSARG